MKSNNEKELVKITYFEAFARQRSNKRQCYFPISSSFIKNKHVIINNHYIIRVYHEGEFIRQYRVFARKKGNKYLNYYFNIKKKYIDKKIIIINNEYHLDVFN